MVQLARPSVQSLFIQTQHNGQPLASATGFIVQSRYGPLLLTNRHVLTGRHQNTGEPLTPQGLAPTEVVIIHNRKDAVGQWLARMEPLFDGPVKRWFEHPSLGDRMDVAALRLTSLQDVSVFPYDIAEPAAGSSLMLGPTDPVSIIGFPFGHVEGGDMLPSWAAGFLASEPVQNFAGLPIQLVDCRSTSGQSGAPVIAFRSGGEQLMEDGNWVSFDGPVMRFVGLYGGRVSANSDLGVVWKASAIRELVESV